MTQFTRMGAWVGAVAVAITGAAAAGVAPVAAAPVAGASSKREVTIRQVAIGMNHGLAVDRNGAVFGWGDNGNGQVGDGTLKARPVPVPAVNGRMPLRVKMTQVAAGGEHSLTLGANGWVYSWGRNLYGQAGQGASAPTFATDRARCDPGPRHDQTHRGRRQRVGCCRQQRTPVHVGREPLRTAR